MKILSINLDNLIHSQAVESVRREFKKSWSKPTREQIIHTICALANDFLNLNGGYIILGIEEQDGVAVLCEASETKKAQGEKLTQLMQMTAKVPFDDRRSLIATVDDISPTLVRNYLASINSTFAP